MVAEKAQCHRFESTKGMARLTLRTLSLLLLGGHTRKQTITVSSHWTRSDCDGVNSDGRREGQILGQAGEESNPTRSRLSMCTDGGYSYLSRLEQRLENMETADRTENERSQH
jgi:hypothetical protein